MPVVKLSANIIKFPLCCPCCMLPPDTHIRVKSHWSTKGNSYACNVPYCRECKSNIRLGTRLCLWMRFFSVCAVLSVFVYMFSHRLGVYAGFTSFTILLACIGAFAFRRMEGPISIKPSFVFLHSYGTVREFGLTNPDYALEFIATNREKVMSYDMRAGPQEQEAVVFRAAVRYLTPPILVGVSMVIFAGVMADNRTEEEKREAWRQAHKPQVVAKVEEPPPVPMPPANTRTVVTLPMITPPVIVTPKTPTPIGPSKMEPDSKVSPPMKTPPPPIDWYTLGPGLSYLTEDVSVRFASAGVTYTKGVPREKRLMVRLEIRNHGQSNRTIQSFSGNNQITLIDDLRHEYRPTGPRATAPITIEPGRRVSEVMLFDMPTTVTKLIRLTIPGECLSLDYPLHLAIESHHINDFRSP